MTWTADPPPDEVGVFDVEVRATVRVTITDLDVVRRCVDNHDDQGRPQPDVRGGSGWRNTYYAGAASRDAVLAMLAVNAVANGETDVSRMDGWADLPAGAATMDVRDVDADGDVTLVGEDFLLSWTIAP